MLTILFTFLAGIAKAFMDIGAKDGFKKRWLNKSFSYIYKYKQPQQICEKAPWYYLFLYKPDYIEKFPYSSTLFVSLTDEWHFAQLLFLTFICLATICYFPIITCFSIYYSMLCDFVILKSILSISFQMFYSLIDRINKKPM